MHPTGFLLINKPVNVNSTTCVRVIKKIIHDKSVKIGHTGTLDSFATGLLIIGIGRAATRHIEKIMTLDKQYRATGKLGELTNTYDYTGTIIEQNPLITLDRKDLEKSITSFGSSYEQTPPIFSALKHNGRRLSELARKKTARHDLQAVAAYKRRIVQLHALQLLSYEAPFFSLHAHVSHGTYIRSLMNDIAVRTGTHATTYALERTHIGPFSLSNAQPLDAFTSLEALANHIIDTERFLAQLK